MMFKINNWNTKTNQMNIYNKFKILMINIKNLNHKKI